VDGKPLAPEPTSQRETTELDRETTAEGQVITTRSANITTLEAALAYSKVDMSRYEVDHFNVNSWEVTISGKRSSSKQDQTYTNYQVKVWLKPRSAGSLGMQMLLDQIAAVPKLPVVRMAKPAGKRPSLLCELGIYDHHFGMLAWNAETGKNYNSQIARGLYAGAVDYALENLAGHRIDRFIIPIGNDLFHMNDNKAETPHSHNRLDVDTRVGKVFALAQEAVLHAIRRALEIAPVEVLWIPGNHDPELSYAMCQFLSGVFIATPHCTVDCSPDHRKYRRYGNTLLGYTHGTLEKMEALPLIMLEACRRDMAETQFHEWHVGHRHKRQQWVFKSETQGHSAIVRVLPSLAPHDQWHHAKGFSKAGNAAEAHLYHPQTGHFGYLTIPVEAIEARLRKSR
jgi:hypothetical protein